MEIRQIESEHLKYLMRIDSTINVEECLDFSKHEINGKYVFELTRQSHPKPFTKKLVSTDEKSYFQMLSKIVKKNLALGAFDGEKCVGIVIAECQIWNRTLHVWEFIVDKAYRRRGLGRELMRSVFRYAEEKGMRSVFVETQSNNVNAIRFYEKTGFNIVGFDQNFYSNKDVEKMEVAIFMRKELSG